MRTMCTGISLTDAHVMGMGNTNNDGCGIPYGMVEKKKIIRILLQLVHFRQPYVN